MNIKKIIAGVIAFSSVCCALPLNDYGVINPSIVNAVENVDSVFGKIHEISDSEGYVYAVYGRYKEKINLEMTGGLFKKDIYSVEYVEVTGYKGQQDIIKVPSEIEVEMKTDDGTELVKVPVKAITGGFRNQKYITDIILPDSITSIGAGSFGGCTGLKKVNIPEGVTSIGDRAFENCKALESLELPDKITYIGTLAFNGCTNLKSMNLPESLEAISEKLFNGCTSLKEVTIHDNVGTIEKSAFDKCENLLKIDIPESVTSIEASAFISCKALSSVTLPSGLTTISTKTFKGCESLIDINIHDNISTIGENAFNGTAIEEVTIPAAMDVIGEKAFEDCKCLTKVTIHDKVRTIKASAFRGCSALTSVTIPARVSVVGDGAFGYSTTYGGKAKDFTIYGYEGTGAQTYAEKCGFTFISLGEAEPTTETATSTSSTTVGKEVLTGDANGDNAVNIADATAIVQFIANPDKYNLTEAQRIAADVCNPGDGVTPMDAYAIQLLEAGVIKSLPYMT